MTYKNSLLIYRTQTFNVQEIWNSKIRLIKNITPLFRSLNENDFIDLENFQDEYKSLVDQTNLHLQNLNYNKSQESDINVIDDIKEQIVDLMLDYVEKSAFLTKKFKNDKILELESRTKTLILIYCTWSEAVFKKLIHTPYGLDLNKRGDIYGTNIETQWKNLIDIILTKIPVQNNQGDLAIMKSDLEEIATKYIIGPSKLRNKIAHGQWNEALNSGNDNIVINTSYDLSMLDIVQIDLSFEVYNYFINILENILESTNPNDMILKNKNSYIFLKNVLDEFISKRISWDTKSRSEFLKQRNFDTRNIKIAKKMTEFNIEKEIIENITGVDLNRL